MQGMQQGAVPELKPEGRDNPAVAVVHQLGLDKEQLLRGTQDVVQVGQVVVAGAVAAFQDAAAVVGAQSFVETAAAVVGAQSFVETAAAAAEVDDGQHLLEGPVGSGSLGAEEKRLQGSPVAAGAWSGSLDIRDTIAALVVDAAAAVVVVGMRFPSLVRF